MKRYYNEVLNRVFYKLKEHIDIVKDLKIFSETIYFTGKYWSYRIIVTDDGLILGRKENGVYEEIHKARNTDDMVEFILI